MNSPPVSASFQRSSHTLHSRFVFLILSGLNLDPPPLFEAWRFGPCSQGFRPSVALTFRLPGQIHPPVTEGGLIPLPLLLCASWRTCTCDFHRIELSLSAAGSKYDLPLFLASRICFSVYFECNVLWQSRCRSRRLFSFSVPPYLIGSIWCICVSHISVIGCWQFGQVPFCPLNSFPTFDEYI